MVSCKFFSCVDGVHGASRGRARGLVTPHGAFPHMLLQGRNHRLVMWFSIMLGYANQRQRRLAKEPIRRALCAPVLWRGIRCSLAPRPCIPATL